MNIQDKFFGVIPLRRKRTADWALPALAGLGVGIAIGVGVGMLYAPSPGEAARLRLREGASRVRDRAADSAHKAKSHISSTAGQAERRVVES